MKARQFTPVEPLDIEPAGAHVDRQEREEAFRDALRGVELGAYDERIVDWALRLFDSGTLRVFVSLLERTRAAGMVDVVNFEAMQVRRRIDGAKNDRVLADFGMSDDASRARGAL